MKALPNVQDVFAGIEIVVHMAKDEPLDVARLKAVLKEHGVKLKGSPEKDADYIL